MRTRDISASSELTPSEPAPSVDLDPIVVRLASALATVAGLAAIATLGVPGLLVGTPVMNGSARGTAVAVLVAAVPVLLVGVALTRRGSPAGPVLLLGSAAYLAYNGVMFAFATPFNQAFLLYTTTLGLAVAVLVAVPTALGSAGVARAYRTTASLRGFAIYLWVVAALNALVWLRTVVPAIASDDRDFLEGSGLTTSPVFVQDLALWLPAACVVAGLLWSNAGTLRHAWGVLLTGAVLVFWVLESFGVALDQWFGHEADPQSRWASVGGAVLFAVLGVVGLGVLVLYRRALARAGSAGQAPTAARTAAASTSAAATSTTARPH